MNKSTALWKIDPAHTDIGFKVRHMMISNVRGVFGEFEGTVEAEDDNFQNATFSFTAKVNTIHTNNDQRDAHLKSADFFDAEKFPTIEFKSSTFDGNTLKGELTIKGISKTITLQTEFNGIAKDNYGNTKAGFELHGKINRKDFGLIWNGVTEAGKVVVSDTVKLVIDLQLGKRAIRYHTIKMTGKQMLEKQPKAIKEAIESLYGSIGNYYNELFQLFAEQHYLSRQEQKPQRWKINQNAIKRMTKELNAFGIDYAEDIIKAVHYDAEIFFDQQEIEAYKKELEKYDAHFNSFWNEVKHLFGF